MKQATLFIDESGRSSLAEKGFLSGGLEITDIVSYISFIRYKRLLSQNKNIGYTSIWEKIKEKSAEANITSNQVRKFFKIKEGEVHKYLKS